MIRAAIAAVLLLFASHEDPLTAARRAYLAGDYLKAVYLLDEAIGEMPNQRDLIRFNQAQTWMITDSARRAESLYTALLPLLPPAQQASALNNMGILAERRGKLDVALESFKDALRIDPNYEKARYNYELLLRRIKNNPPPPNPPPPAASNAPPPPRNPPPSTENSGENKPMTEVTPEQAKDALRQLQANERQYLQQLKRRNKERKRYSNTQDW